MKSQTKASIVVTFTRFLASITGSNTELVEDSLVGFLKPIFSHLVKSPCMNLRSAACDLFYELHGQGHLKLSEAIELLI